MHAASHWPDFLCLLCIERMKIGPISKIFGTASDFQKSADFLMCTTHFHIESGPNRADKSYCVHLRLHFFGWTRSTLCAMHNSLWDLCFSVWFAVILPNGLLKSLQSLWNQILRYSESNDVLDSELCHSCLTTDLSILNPLLSQTKECVPL